jgi:phosphonate transport system substrate-binding protein
MHTPSRSRRVLLRHLSAVAAVAVAAPLVRAQPRRLRCAVGPFLPSPEDTRRAYTPFFAHLAAAIGRPDFDLAVTTDWAGLAVAMGSGNLDLAWMGPWGYMLAHQASGCRAIATVKYEGRPTYHAIIIGRPDLAVARFPDDTRGRSISFADVGSTSGWLIPQYYAKETWRIDPRRFWKYTEGASHPGNEIAVQSGQVDLATDYDRNRNAMIDAGRIRADATRIVWQSEPLPNDAIAVARDFPADHAGAAQRAMLAISPEAAVDLLPKRYTGFVAASHDSYALIEKAGLALGRLKPA